MSKSTDWVKVAPGAKYNLSVVNTSWTLETTRDVDKSNVLLGLEHNDSTVCESLIKIGPCSNFTLSYCSVLSALTVSLVTIWNPLISAST